MDELVQLLISNAGVYLSLPRYAPDYTLGTLLNFYES